MTQTPITRVRLDRHPDHPDAVTATLAGTGAGADTVRALLTGHGFRPLDAVTMVLARIDHEEPHHAQQAATALRSAGAAVEITPGLQDEMDTEWTWADYPMPWLTRDEIREVSQEAQQIHDDIAAGRLVIHRHAHDGHTTVAVGTYPGGKSIHLHGENHLRQTTLVYDTTAEALREFDHLYTDAVRPGPALATETEQGAAAALAGTSAAGAGAPSETAPAEPSPLRTETVPVYAADPGDHEALLRVFLETQGEWEKYRPWDETTVASHESLTLRAEFVHEAGPRDTAWTVAAYESPVGERIWHATATAAAPVEIVRALLDSLASEHAWGGGLDAKITEKTLAEAARPLADTGWQQQTDGRCMNWTAPTSEPAGLRFDAFAAQRPSGLLPTWTLWGGNTPHQPAWAIHLSTHTPAALLQDLTHELAQGEGVRQLRDPVPERSAPATVGSPGQSCPAMPGTPAAARNR
ncbi:DUF317 domain-containing protein [Streptomyces sp. NBC_00690]|uniref:DUF317 domain-containing protein n=1 Tax=Streptomyces sp. NBC_00690 TaxID=2975808 RepID=UPI002E2D9817|nr:DUF317 domain-containing protein [Streptomyces sp. NBC_00690]